MTGLVAPCGHPGRTIAGGTVECIARCRCERCGSPSLRKHSFGTDPHGQWHDERLPHAVICTDCRWVMFHGGLLP
jgi:hypothetical protein